MVAKGKRKAKDSPVSSAASSASVSPKTRRDDHVRGNYKMSGNNGRGIDRSGMGPAAHGLMPTLGSDVHTPWPRRARPLDSHHELLHPHDTLPRYHEPEILQQHARQPGAQTSHPMSRANAQFPMLYAVQQQLFPGHMLQEHTFQQPTIQQQSLLEHSVQQHGNSMSMAPGQNFPGALYDAITRYTMEVVRSTALSHTQDTRPPDPPLQETSTPDPPLERDEKTTIRIFGIKYTRSAPGTSKSTHYRCSARRSKKCTAAVRFSPLTLKYTVIQPTHICLDEEDGLTQNNVVVAMAAAVDSLALTDFSTKPEDIWMAVRQQFYDHDTEHAVVGLEREQVLRRVRRIRNKQLGGDVFRLLESGELSLVVGTILQFFRFHVVLPPAKHGSKPRRIIGWAHPQLLTLLKQHKVSLFVDGTFRCVPRGFAQCVVIMAHHHATDLFVPVYYILTSDRSEDTYYDMLHSVIVSTDHKVEPGSVVCDFEKALMNAVRTQFPEDNFPRLIIGCLFHFKQAVRRRMKRLRIPNREASIAMEVGNLDMLTVIDHSKIASHGIPWARATIRRVCRAGGIKYSRRKWESFWVYFDKVWLHHYAPSDWNVHGLDREVIARTNNPLERFNRKMNDAFPTPHPSLATFVKTISKMSKGYAERLSDAAIGRSRPLKRVQYKKKKKGKKAKTSDDDDGNAFVELPTPIVFTDDPFEDSDVCEESMSADEEDGEVVEVLSTASAESDVNDDVDTSFEYVASPLHSDRGYESHDYTGDSPGGSPSDDNTGDE